MFNAEPLEYPGVSANLASTFWELVRLPFQHSELIWGIVPLYFGWVVNELTSPKASFSTAVQTGFALLWAGAQWVVQTLPRITRNGVLPAPSLLNMGVTLVVLCLGILALWSGLRRRYPRGMSFLGHTRFAGYFMIALFPVQSGYLGWTLERVLAIVVFAVPIWLMVHLALLPLRRQRTRGGARRR